MKRYVLIVFVCGCAGASSCGGGSSSTASMGDTPKTSEPDGGSGGPSDTVLWIGESAHWNDPGGASYDGNYDADNGIFVICGNHKSVVVPRNQITFQVNGTCDTSFTNRVRVMMVMTSNTTARIIGETVHLPDPDHAPRKAEITLGSSTHTIDLKEKDASRLVKAINTEKEAEIRQERVRVMSH